jgi:hypothetical protein
MIDLDARLCTKIFKFPCSKLSPVISDDIVENVKYVHDLFHEFQCLSRGYGCSRLDFDPFGELLNYNEGVCEPTFSFFERTYQI